MDAGAPHQPLHLAGDQHEPERQDQRAGQRAEDDGGIAPGPAISGVASGKTEMSAFASASAVSSAVVDVPPEGRSP